MSILDAIGHTDLVPLRHRVVEGGGQVYVKLEYQNPTGSMKDRMALAMVEAAQRDGRLQPGGSVVEYTAGSTGVSLAFVCTAKRIPLEIVTSDAFSIEKRSHMEALGARLHLVHSPGGGSHFCAPICGTTVRGACRPGMRLGHARDFPLSWNRHPDVLR